MPYNAQFDLRGKSISSSYNQVSQFDTSSGNFYTGQGQQLFVTASLAFTKSSAISTSYSQFTDSSTISVSSSFSTKATTSVTSSFSLTSSLAVTALSALTATSATTATSSSNANTASVTITASYVKLSDSSSFNVSSSYAITASSVQFSDTASLSYDGTNITLLGEDGNTEIQIGQNFITAHDGDAAGVTINSGSLVLFGGENSCELIFAKLNGDANSGSILMGTTHAAIEMLTNRLILTASADIFVEGRTGITLSSKNSNSTLQLDNGNNFTVEDGAGGTMQLNSGSVYISDGHSSLTLNTNTTSSLIMRTIAASVELDGNLLQLSSSNVIDLQVAGGADISLQGSNVTISSSLITFGGQQTDRLNVIGGNNGTQPTSGSFALPINQQVFGDTSAFLGNPTGWLDVQIAGVARKIPYY